MAHRFVKDAQDNASTALGRYRLHGEIASGGMATVHFGRLVGTGGFAKTVAIKRLHPQFAKIPEFVAMFLAEARLAARIRHPNVVQPLDVLQTDDEVFLVMEYIDGDSLSRQIKASIARGERVPLHIGVAILCNVLHGLHAAHEAKNDKGEPLEMVHRDVSPQNVLVGVDGIARVIDFGIAKAADSAQITRHGELKGKLSYMAPEQLSGGKVTRKVDLYAASVVLWEVLTGQRLFDADYQSAILKSILHRPVDPPSEIVADLPHDLDAIVLKGLARDPDDRFATAREMALALEERIVLANPSSIGAWVETVSAQSLEKRAARIAEIEGNPSASSSEPHEVISDMIISELRREESVMRARKEPELEPLVPPAEVSTRTGAVGPPVAAAPAPPVPPRLDPPNIAAAGGGTLRLPATPPVLGSRPPPPTIAIPEGPPVAPAWPVPGIGVAPVGSTPIPEAIKKRSQGNGTLVLLFVVAIVVAGFYFVLPELLKRGYVSSAARDGLSLAIDQVDLSVSSIHLGGVTVTAADVPGVTLRARGIDLSLKGIDPKQMSIHDASLSIDGGYSAVHDTVSAWVSAHASRDETNGTIDRITLDSVKIAWSRPFGDATRVDVENANGAIERQGLRALGDDLDIVAPNVKLTMTSTGTLGPWRVRWQRDPKASRVNALLDPASGAQGNVVITEGGLADLDVRIPRVTLAALSIPPTAFGRRGDDPFFVDLTLKYSVLNSSHATGEAHMTLSGVRIPGAAMAVDAELYGKVDGDPVQPLEVKDGTGAFGPFRGKVTGPLLVTSEFVKSDFSWKAAASRCPNADQALTGGLRFDSRNIDDTSVVLTPSAKCGLKIFGP